MSAEDHIRKMAEHARDPNRFSKEQLRAFVERVEAAGYSTRALKRVVRVREYEAEHGKDARKSEEMILETYLGALGMLD